MTKITGRQMSLGIGKETTRGTAVAPTYWIPWADLTLEEQVEKVLDDTALGVIEDSDANDTVKKYLEFSIGTKLKDDHIGLILLSLFGACSSAVKETTAYNHTFTVAQDNTHESLTIAEKSSNEDLRYPNCVVESLQLTGSLGDYIRYVASGKGLLQASASNTVSNSQEYDFKPQDLTFKHASAVSGLDGASAVSIREFNININQNLFDEDVLGSVTPSDFLNQQFSVEGSVTLVHNAATYQDLMLNGTYQALRFDLVGSETIGGSSNPRLKIDLDRCSLFDYSRDRSLNGIIIETFSFKGHYDLTNSSMIEVLLTNEITSY